MMTDLFRTLELNEVCEAIIDCEHKTAPRADTGYPSIRTPNIGRGFFLLDGVYRVNRETFEKWTQRGAPEPGDLILAREAPVGNVAMIPEGLEPCLGQRTVLIRPDREKVYPRYLNYLLLGDEVQSHIHSQTNGATVAHLNMKDIRSLPLPSLPGLPTQRKIAGILSAYDDLIENNLRRIKILEEMAQSLYREWFVHFRFPGHESIKMVDSSLGLIPEGWEVRKLKDECELTMGQSPKSEFYNDRGEGTPFHQGVTNFGEHFPTDRLYCTVGKRIAEEGDILFSVRAPVGRINVANKRIVIGRGVSAIRHANRSQNFLLFQLKCLFQEEDSMGNGAIFKAVTKSDMQNIKLIVPDSKLVAGFESAGVPIFAEIKNLTDRNHILRQTRDLLLPKLLSGNEDI